jgi:hypothetical protein
MSVVKWLNEDGLCRLNQEASVQRVKCAHHAEKDIKMDVPRNRCAKAKAVEIERVAFYVKRQFRLDYSHYKNAPNEDVTRRNMAENLEKIEALEDVKSSRF